nr:hypothetical protein [Dendronalium sp. ChiSLP03b]MDZ8207678.1 hypothetical protein [Dendronalium sp. ChiSLP03b]
MVAGLIRGDRIIIHGDPKWAIAIRLSICYCRTGEVRSRHSSK